MGKKYKIVDLFFYPMWGFDGMHPFIITVYYISEDPNPIGWNLTLFDSPYTWVDTKYKSKFKSQFYHSYKPR